MARSRHVSLPNRQLNSRYLNLETQNVQMMRNIVPRKMNNLKSSGIVKFIFDTNPASNHVKEPRLLAPDHRGGLPKWTY